MNNQILTLAFFMFLIILVSGICWIRIARIEFKKLTDKSPITKQHLKQFDGML